MSDCTTEGIRVTVQSSWIEERSDPRQSHYFFAYRVTITNLGAIPAQLVSREWIITDADGNVETVRGPGVVGEQPLLASGETFEYTSFCPLRTPFGTMHGKYVMVDGTGRTFDAIIDPFALAAPNAVN